MDGVSLVAEQPERGHQHQALVLPREGFERRQIAGLLAGVWAVHRLCHREERQGLHPFIR